MFQTLKQAFKVKEIRRKIWLTLFLLLIFRLGSFLPLPGIDFKVFSEGFNGTDGVLGLLSAITGGALANASFLALGISPYINASIIVQLLTVAIPKLEELSKQGQEGRRKINQITRYVTLGLALAQSIGIIVSWGQQGYLMTDVFGTSIGETAQTWMVGVADVIILIGGSVFTMWLGEKITELGIGNGISLLIFVGILATAAQQLLVQFKQIGIEVPEGNLIPIWELLAFFVLTLLIFAFIVFFDLAERRISIQYAKQVKGRKMMGGQSSYIPIKVNASGVLPIIFAIAIITFPTVIASLFAKENSAFMQGWNTWIGTSGGQAGHLYTPIMALLILGFSFFYAQIQFNPEEISRNIQQYGGFVNGIRPGKPTAEYLGRINKRLTLFGAIFLAVIALVPSLIFRYTLPNSTLNTSFTSTGLLIVVSVALEFDKQLQGQLMMKNYKGFLK